MLLPGKLITERALQQIQYFAIIAYICRYRSASRIKCCHSFSPRRLCRVVWRLGLLYQRVVPTKKGVLKTAVLVTLSVPPGYLFSVAATFFQGEVFYEAVLLLAFVLFGHWMEMRPRAGDSQATQALMNLAPPKTTVIRNGEPVEVATSDIILGDIVLIRPDNKIPVGACS